MYINPIIVGVVGTILTEIAVAIAVVIYQTNKWNDKDETTESTN